MNIFTRKISTLLFFAALSLTGVAQDNMGIGTLTPHPTAILDLTADDKGFIAPRLTTAQRDAIVGPATGLLITTNRLKI